MEFYKYFDQPFYVIVHNENRSVILVSIDCSKVFLSLMALHFEDLLKKYKYHSGYEKHFR